MSNLFYVVMDDYEYKIIERTTNQGPPPDRAPLNGEQLSTTRQDAERCIELERRRVLESVDTCY